jgi:hypothetical protein
MRVIVQNDDRQQDYESLLSDVVSSINKKPVVSIVKRLSGIP